MKNEVKLIDMNTLWKCETCFYQGPNGCKTWCDAGEGYRPAASKLEIINPESLRPKGQWIVNRRHTVSKKPYIDDNYHIDVICSECSFCIQAENASFGFPEPIKTNYCPNCGANMKEETECPKM